MAALAALAMFPSNSRTRFAVAAGLLIAAAAPLMTNLPWGGTPALLQEYLVPGHGRGRFPFFPCAAYIAFGQAIGTVVKRAAAERFDAHRAGARVAIQERCALDALRQNVEQRFAQPIGRGARGISGDALQPARTELSGNHPHQTVTNP